MSSWLKNGEDRDMKDRSLSSTKMFVFAMAAWCVGIVGWATWRDMGVSADSCVYLFAARSCAAGEGLRTGPAPGFETGVPLQLYPPLYPMLLGMTERCGIPLPQGAKALNIICVALSAMGLALCLLRIAPPYLALAICAVFCTHTVFLLPHTMVWSEPLFVTFLLALGIGISSPRRSVIRAMGLGVLAGGLCLTRYAGVAFAATAFAMFLCEDTPLRRRLRYAGAFAGMASLCVGVWCVQTLTTPDAVDVRHFVLHPPGLWHLRTLAGAMFEWVAPADLGSFGLRAISVAAWTFIAIWLVRSSWSNRHFVHQPGLSARADVRFWSWGGAAYLALLLFVMLFVNALTPLDERLLLPAFLCAILAITPKIGRWVGGLGGSPLFCILLLVAALNVIAAGRLALRASTEGLEYSKVRRTPPPVFALLAALPPQVRVLSNAPDLIYAITDRPAWEVPLRMDPFTELATPPNRLEGKLRALRVSALKGEVCFFAAPGFVWRRYQLPEAKVVEVLGLMPAFEAAASRLYLPPSRPKLTGDVSR